MLRSPDHQEEKQTPWSKCEGVTTNNTGGNPLNVGTGYVEPISLFNPPADVEGRLAVDKGEQRTGLGKALLKDALARIARAADIVGARAVLVHAIDQRARTFYERFDFEPSPIHELQLMLLMKDLRKALEE